jgi:hypothetical protein
MIALFPEKHARLNETLLGLGAIVLLQLRTPQSVDDVWEAIKDLRTRKKSIPERISFDDVILAIDLLFALQAVKVNEQGEVERCA